MLSDFVVSLELELLELGVLEEPGVEEELELGDELELGLLALGLVLEPEAALPDVLPLAPPLAWSFFVSVELDAEPDTEPEGDVLDELGEDGEVVDPDEDDVEPDGEVVVPREAARSPPLSQAATSAVPRATETASASVLNLIG